MVYLPNLKLDRTIVEIVATIGIEEEVDGQRGRVVKVSITGVLDAVGEDVTYREGVPGPVEVGAGAIAGAEPGVAVGATTVGDHAVARGAGAGATRARGVDPVQERLRAPGREIDIDDTPQEHGGTLDPDLVRENGLVVPELHLSSASHPLDVVMHRLTLKIVIAIGLVGGTRTVIAPGGTRMS
jgi:hypothetical protein